MDKIKTENRCSYKPEYTYYLYTWGGFYNDKYIELHGYFEKGAFFFDTKEERDSYIKELKNAEEKYNAKYLIFQIAEGYNLSVESMPCIHRVVEYKGVKYYSYYQLHWPMEITNAAYIKQYKWYPGFNDETVEEILQEEVNYEEVEIIEEWYTGKFKDEYEYHNC